MPCPQLTPTRFPGATLPKIKLHRNRSPTLEIDGKPPEILKLGQANHIDPGVIHNAKNNSTTVPFKTLVVYVIEQGKPVAIPAPPK